MTRRVLRGFDAQSFCRGPPATAGSASATLSRLADVSQATVFNWEAGKSTPQVDLLARVMRILDAPIEQVVTIPAGERYPGDWRVIKGLTQPELAAAAKIATTTLRGIERADLALDRRQRREAGQAPRDQRRGVPRGLPARPAAPRRHPRVTCSANSANMDSRQLAAHDEIRKISDSADRGPLNPPAQR